jgi:hypothetical protein
LSSIIIVHAKILTTWIVRTWLNQYLSNFYHVCYICGTYVIWQSFSSFQQHNFYQWKCINVVFFMILVFIFFYLDEQWFFSCNACILTWSWAFWNFIGMWQMLKT